MSPIDSGERLKELKRQIALNEYDVDARLVAGAILAKLRLVKRSRQAIGVEADRIRQAGQSDRRRPRE